MNYDLLKEIRSPENNIKVGSLANREIRILVRLNREARVVEMTDGTTRKLPAMYSEYYSLEDVRKMTGCSPRRFKACLLRLVGEYGNVNGKTSTTREKLYSKPRICHNELWLQSTSDLEKIIEYLATRRRPTLPEAKKIAKELGIKLKYIV